MSRANLIDALGANSGSDGYGATRRHFRRKATPDASLQIVRVARNLWPNKTAEHLAEHAAISRRQAQRVVAEEAGLSGVALANLIRHSGKVGFAFLEALCEIDPTDAPDWWAEIKYQREAARLQDEIAAARKRHSELKRNSLRTRRA